MDTGQVETFGQVQGFITYGSDGRMLVLIVEGNRPKAESLAKMTDEQRVGLFRTMNAYGGTYTLGGKLIYTTRPAPHVSDGKMSVITLVWEKVK